MSSAMALLLCLAAMATETDGAVRRVDVFERGSACFASTEARVHGQSVALPLGFLVDRLGMERKALPDGRVGVCRGELCIPFSVGDGADQVIRRDGAEFVPVDRLVEVLGGIRIWDTARDELLMDLRRRLEPDARIDGPVDVTLRDLAGRDVPLERFRGRKVLLFAWASW